METYRFRKLIHRLPGRVIHAVPLPEPEVIEGHGSRGEIGQLCAKIGYHNVLLVTDRTLAKLCFEQTILRSLDEAGVAYTVYVDINSEPTVAIIENGRRCAQEGQAECIIALGGGSVLDSCKMIAASIKLPHMPVKALLRKFLPILGKSLPLIMVPSTAGTGAERTVGAVVMNASGVKSSSVLIGLNITHVVLDSELTVHAPSSVTAACGMDALSHCVEGVVGDVPENEHDMHLSLEGTRLILENLPIVMREPENVEARLAMCRAAMYGGNAINTQLAGYVHAFAHSIGAKYHIPHGQAISLMMIPVLEFQKEFCLAKYAQIARYCGLASEKTVDDDAAEQFLTAVRELMKVCRMDQIQSPVRAEDYDQLTAMVAADSINYSAPQTFSNADIRTILVQMTNS